MKTNHTSFILILILASSISSCYGSTFEPDTIDNWQIYNGTELILAGPNLKPTNSKVTIQRIMLKGLIIQFNHCAAYSDEFDVVLEVADKNGKNLMTKTFKYQHGAKMKINGNELIGLNTSSITIRYYEKRKNGTDQVLGTINLL